MEQDYTGQYREAGQMPHPRRVPNAEGHMNLSTVTVKANQYGDGAVFLTLVSQSGRVIIIEDMYHDTAGTLVIRVKEAGGR